MIREMGVIWRNSAAIVAGFCASVVLSGCASAPSHPPSNGSRSVVIWISIDGMRHDYVDRYSLPFFLRRMADGAYTRQLAPTFPSLTFPVHTSQITGVNVDRHGITSNTFYDSTTKQTYKFADDAALM